MAQYSPPCPSGCTISGYVYKDNNQNSIYDSGSGDVGIANQTVHITIPETYIPAYTEPGWTEVTSIDNDQNPTGWIFHPPVYHPAETIPEQHVASPQTDSTGHYSVSGVPAYKTYRAYHSTLPAGYAWINPSNGMWDFYTNSDKTLDFGVYPTFHQNAPGSLCSGQTPTIPLSWPAFPSAAKYEIYYKNSSNGTLRDTNTSTTGTSYSATTAMGLIPGQQYSFLLDALDGSGNHIVYSDGGKWSNELYGYYSSLPVCAPPQFFNQNTPVSSCNSPGNPNIRLSWGTSTNATRYDIYYVDKSVGTPAFLISTTNTYYDITSTLIKGHSYGFQIRAVNSIGSVSTSWSYNPPGDYTLYQLCANPPTVNVSISTPTGGPYIAPTLPVHVNQNTNPVTLVWSENNADPNSCVASGAWNGPIPNSGSQIINTSTPSDNVYSVTCSNTFGSTTNSIQLVVDQYPKPYIQTTGGDVHSNETIYISP